MARLPLSQPLKRRLSVAGARRKYSVLPGGASSLVAVNAKATRYSYSREHAPSDHDPNPLAARRPSANC
ncbi:hypothetical protein BKA80DRAFT_13322 [Phyllosticta citrichinensis]